MYVFDLFVFFYLSIQGPQVSRLDSVDSLKLRDERKCPALTNHVLQENCIEMQRILTTSKAEGPRIRRRIKLHGRHEQE